MRIDTTLVLPYQEPSDQALTSPVVATMSLPDASSPLVSLTLCILPTWGVRVALGFGV